MVVAAVVIGSLTQVVTSYVHISQRGRYLNLANSFIEAKTEALRNGGYNNLALGTTNISAELPAELPLVRSASMTVTNPIGGIKQVDLDVSYREQGQDRSYGYTTYIGELGVGQ